MSVYTISDIQVHDAEKYKEYVGKMRPIVESFGGHYHVRGGEVTVRTGDWKPNRLIIIEFPAKERMAEFAASPEYQPVADIRKSASRMVSSIVVDGFDGETNNI